MYVRPELESSGNPVDALREPNELSTATLIDRCVTAMFKPPGITG